MSASDIGQALASHPHVADVHDLHVWEVATGFPSPSAHVFGPARR
jgi:cobalt-zinc-cadmium efflux system protein